MSQTTSNSEFILDCDDCDFRKRYETHSSANAAQAGHKQHNHDHRMDFIESKTVEESEFKRDIREDIVETIGIQELPPIHSYDVPDSGDRKFNIGHIKFILQYLDVKPPVDTDRWKFHNSLARHVNEMMSVSREGDGISHTDTAPVYTGFTKDELVLIRDAVKSYDPIGLPSAERIADRIQEEFPKVERERAMERANQQLNHYGRQPGGDQLRVGFTAEEVVPKRRVSVRVERDGS